MDNEQATRIDIRMDVPRIAQIGAGVVGSAAGSGFSAQGFDVLFVDSDPSAVRRLSERGHKAVTCNDFDGSDIDIFLISVPAYRLGDINDTGAIKDAAGMIGSILRDKNDYAVVAIRNSVVPGTTEEIVIPLLEERSVKTVGCDFGVCVNPTYLRTKSAAADFMDAPLVLIGEYDKCSGDHLSAIYDWVDCPVHRVALRTAEMQKFVHNAFNSAKISLFNEFREICDAEGIDADQVFRNVCLSAEGMWNPAYGTLDFGPFDGMSLPNDTKAFRSYAERVIGRTDMVRATLDVNSRAEDIISRKLRTTMGASGRNSGPSCKLTPEKATERRSLWPDGPE